MNNLSSTAAAEEIQLLERIGRRDRQALARLYDRYATTLYSTIVRILPNAEDAGEVLEESFMQIWEQGPAYNPALGRPFNWALTIARLKAIDRLRSLHRQYSFLAEVTNELASGTTPPGAGNDDVFGYALASRIRAAVDALPLEQRQAIEMAFLGGMTQTEIAETLQQPLPTIRSRIRRGMMTLRESLREAL